MSSEAERAGPKPHCKHPKRATLRIDREQIIPYDRASLPDNAQFKGYQRVVVQDILLTTDTVCFLKEKFYSPSQQRTYLASAPPGYDGQFGPNLKALVLGWYFESGMSEPIILALLAQAGMQISSGQLSNLLLAERDTFHMRVRP